MSWFGYHAYAQSSAFRLGSFESNCTHNEQNVNIGQGLGKWPENRNQEIIRDVGLRAAIV